MFGLLNSFTIRLAFYGVILAAIGFGIYQFHYRPINDLRKEVQLQEKIAADWQHKLTDCSFDKHNLEELLKKAKADLETEKMNTELCYAEAEAYKEDNETIKDTADEGYLTF